MERPIFWARQPFFVINAPNAPAAADVTARGIPFTSSGRSFKKPKGGLCFWIKLPDNISSKAVYINMLSKGVGILPGVVFSENKDNFIRISFAQCEEKNIEKGVDLLASAIEKLK